MFKEVLDRARRGGDENHPAITKSLLKAILRKSPNDAWNEKDAHAGFLLAMRQFYNYGKPAARTPFQTPLEPNKVAATPSSYVKRRQEKKSRYLL